MNWQQRMSAWLGHCTQVMMQAPKRSLLILLVLLLAMASNLRFITLDTDIENFIDAEAPARIAYNQVKETFGRNDVAVIALSGDVLSAEFLTDLQAISTALEETNNVEDVISLFTLPYQVATEDGLLVEDLISEIPTSEQQWQALAERIQASKQAREMLINDDLSATTIIVKPHTYQPIAVAEAFSFDTDFSFDASTEKTDRIPLTAEESKAVVADVQAIIDAYPKYSPHQAGMPALTTQLEAAMQSEMLTFIRLTILLIAVALLIAFRRGFAVIAPLAAVVTALVLTMSTLAAAGQPVQLPLIMLPSFLLAIAIGDAVHLLTHYYRKLNIGENKVAAMRHAVEQTAVPMFLTSLTTAAGLLSLAIGDMVPLRNLGIFGAFGVMAAFVFTITLIPILAALVKTKPRQLDDEHSPLMQRISQVAWQHSGKLALVWLVAVLIAFSQIVQLRFSYDPMAWMPDNMPVKVATQVIDENLGGSINLEVLFDTGRPDGVKAPEFLQTLAQWQLDMVAQHDDISTVSSIVDVIQETHKVLNPEQTDPFDLPTSEQLVNQELFLFETNAAGELGTFVDSTYQTAKATLVLPWKDIIEYEVLFNELRAETADYFVDSADTSASGMLAIMADTMAALAFTTAESYGVAAIAITIMLMLLLVSFRLGLLAMVPNLAPIIVVMGLMVPLGISLDMFTMLVATIAIGITVDNTVHFTHHFRQAHRDGHSVQTSLEHAFQGAGKALLTTSIVLTCGFYVFLFSEMKSVFNLGFLSGTAFLLAMLSNFTITPFLLKWYYRGELNDAASTR
ncbi:efflux RND transporter permease subunit [Salinibius halmophilus]|uniref:efflux RND transporter permease subunit n=1 Tax=Salinibius halmophilus TaxID=1853216 RepID=UPI000E66FDDB|nr:MMPL family transporter [Salinibius halmophilus]